jgi:hypothetical protein
MIEYDSESNFLDFKMEQYPLGKDPKKNELLKDISAFANHYSEADKFIIIGVIEKNGKAQKFVNIENLTDDSKYQQFIKANVEPKINFEYKPFSYKNFQLAYFRIFNNSDRPYLIKKEIKNPATNKTDFFEGDGFIRNGTSTRRMLRNDFDFIYKEKYQATDRKSDLSILPYCEFSNDELLSQYEMKYLDIEIENISNKSIDIDVEMKVPISSSYSLIKSSDLRREIRKKSSNSSPMVGTYDPIIEMPSINVGFNEYEDHILLSTNLKILQNSKIKEVFDGILIILQKESNTINIEVFIRSDDFPQGAVIDTFKVTT